MLSHIQCRRQTPRMKFLFMFFFSLVFLPRSVARNYFCSRIFFLMKLPTSSTHLVGKGVKQNNKNIIRIKKYSLTEVCTSSRERRIILLWRRWNWNSICYSFSLSLCILYPLENLHHLLMHSAVFLFYTLQAGSSYSRPYTKCAEQKV